MPPTHLPAILLQLTQLKSTFQAYAAPISASKSLTLTGTNGAAVMKGAVLPSLLAHLSIIEPRTRRATHAMYAWRVRLPSALSAQSATSPGILLCGSSNGGETGAGERLERLLELSRCEDVVVVVFRWYGGVKLGSDRWKCISTVAKEALLAGGFSSRDETSGKREHANSQRSDMSSPNRRRR
ncbi:ribosomal protein S5 domain 2-like protein [Trametes gibbosa]|nr:ribosomal protein S5 domain 2-like protein [Trametes gibbosa]